MKFIFIFILIHFLLISFTEKTFARCFEKDLIIEKKNCTKSLLGNLETREIKILFPDLSISRLYAVRLSTANFRSQIYLQKNKDSMINASELVKRLNATIIINAGFYNHNYRPMGFFRRDNKTYNSLFLFKGSRRLLHFGDLLHIDK